VVPDRLRSIHAKNEVVMNDALAVFGHDQHLYRSLVMVEFIVMSINADL
jgi:hypothetical protein